MFSALLVLVTSFITYIALPTLLTFVSVALIVTNITYIWWSMIFTYYITAGFVLIKIKFLCYVMLCYVIISYTTRHLHPCISEHKYSGWFRTSGESIFVDIWNDICRARLLRQDEGNTEIRKTLLLVNDTYFDIKAIFSQDLSQPSYYKLIAWCFLYNIIVGVYVRCIQHSAAQKMKRKFNKNAWRCFL